MSHGVPITSLNPGRRYIASFDRLSAAAPTNRELALIRAYIEFMCLGGYYTTSHGKQILAKEMPTEAGHNTLVLHKRGDDDWAYRMISWQDGGEFWPPWRSPDPERGDRLALSELLDHIIGDGNIGGRWETWKRAKPEMLLGLTVRTR